MNNQIRRELLNRHRQSGFPGSIMDVFSAYNAGRDIISEFVQEQQKQQQLQQMQQMQQQQSQPIVANTPEQQEQGLRPYHEAGQTDQSMVFPNIPANTPFNTVGMKAPINIDKYDNQGHLIESFKSVPPGIQNLPTGPQEGTVVETPANMQTGGVRKYQTAGPRRNTNAEITTLQPMDVRPDPLIRDRPVQRVIDPRAQRQTEEQAFQTLMFNKTNEWRDPNKRAAMTSGRAESVSPATYVTPAGDLQGIIESGAQIAKGDYVGGGLGAGLAAASVLLPGTIRVPGNSLGENVGKELITPPTSSSWRSGLLPATQRAIDELVYHSPEQQVRRAQEWMSNWSSHPETKRRVNSIIDDSDTMRSMKLLQYNSPQQPIKDYIDNFDYDVKLEDLRDQGLYGYSTLYHPLLRSPNYFNKTENSILGSSVVDPSGPKVGSTTIHELTHSQYPKEFIDRASIRTLDDAGDDIFERHLVPEAITDLRNYEKTQDHKSHYLGYLADPTEQHARIMELRRLGELRPGQIVDPNTIDYLRRKNKYAGIVDDSFFNMYKHPQGLADLFNTLPAVGAVGGAAAIGMQGAKPEQREGLKKGGVKKYLKLNKKQWLKNK